MSTNENKSRKTRFSDKQYENSSVYNKSVKSQLHSLSIDLPRHQKKYTNIEKQILAKQRANKMTAVINLTNTKYPIFVEVCGAEGLNWKIQSFNQTKTWNIKWVDTGVTNEMLQRMSYHQKINHFPNMSIITRKNNLAVTLSYMKEQFPHHYDYIPRTFLYPNEYGKIRHYYVESRKRGLVKTFIVKPEAGCQGKGIYLTQNPVDFEKEEKCVIQKYIANPLLYQGLKFDLRIYVLVASCNPLRIYLYNQGLVRFATQQYQLPDPKNIQNFYIHLTNYAINKSNPSYQYNYTVKDMSYGHKKSLAQFFKTLKEMGFKANLYWSQVKDNIIKTIIAAQPFLLNNYKMCRPQEPSFNMCFQLLGFDFMIDNQDRCMLLEVNHTPSFATDTPLDHIIKKNLIRDTLLMMNPQPEEINLREKLERIKQREKYVKFKNGSQNSLQRQMLIQQLNQIRQNHQLEFKGTYQIIYPSKNEAKMVKYHQYLTYATKLLQKQANPNSSTSIPSTSELRNKLGGAALQNRNNINNSNGRSSKKLLKSEQFVSKNSLGSDSNKKKNIIYNYNIIKKDKDLPSKRTLLTLPAEPHRVQVHPKQKFVSSRNIRIQSKDKWNAQSLSRDGRIPQSVKPQHRYNKADSLGKYDEYIKPKEPIYRVMSEERQSPIRDMNSFGNRIRAYKTPLMF